jgi:hypothetical protein
MQQSLDALVQLEPDPVAKAMLTEPEAAREEALHRHRDPDAVIPRGDRP